MCPTWPAAASINTFWRANIYSNVACCDSIRLFLGRSFLLDGFVWRSSLFTSSLFVTMASLRVLHRRLKDTFWLTSYPQITILHVVLWGVDMEHSYPTHDPMCKYHWHCLPQQHTPLVRLFKFEPTQQMMKLNLDILDLFTHSLHLSDATGSIIRNYTPLYGLSSKFEPLYNKWIWTRAVALHLNYLFKGCMRLITI